MSDITLAVGGGTRRMTYAELAAVRGISAVSAERLVRRRRWPRQAGNDGVVRVLVPLTEARKRRQGAAPDMSPNSGDVVRTSGLSPLISAPDIPPDIREDIPLTIRTLETAIATLREQLATANWWGEAECARADRGEQQIIAKDAVIDHLRARLDHLITILTDRRPWWRRWFR